MFVAENFISLYSTSSMRNRAQFLSSCHFDVFTKSTPLLISVCREYYLTLISWWKSQILLSAAGSKWMSNISWNTPKFAEKKKELLTWSQVPKLLPLLWLTESLRNLKDGKAFSDHLAWFLILWMQGPKPWYIFSLLLYGLTLNFIANQKLK